MGVLFVPFRRRVDVASRRTPPLAVGSYRRLGTQGHERGGVFFVSAPTTASVWNPSGVCIVNNFVFPIECCKPRRLRWRISVGSRARVDTAFRCAIRRRGFDRRQVARPRTTAHVTVGFPSLVCACVAVESYRLPISSASLYKVPMRVAGDTALRPARCFSSAHHPGRDGAPSQCARHVRRHHHVAATTTLPPPAHHHHHPASHHPASHHLTIIATPATTPPSSTPATHTAREHLSYPATTNLPPT